MNAQINNLRDCRIVHAIKVKEYCAAIQRLYEVKLENITLTKLKNKAIGEGTKYSKKNVKKELMI